MRMDTGFNPNIHFAETESEQHQADEKNNTWACMVMRSRHSSSIPSSDSPVAYLIKICYGRHESSIFS